MVWLFRENSEHIENTGDWEFEFFLENREYTEKGTAEKIGSKNEKTSWG